MDVVTRDTRDARMRAVEIVSDAGAYIATHAEDFVARAGSDEEVLADGFDTHPAEDGSWTLPGVVRRWPAVDQAV